MPAAIQQAGVSAFGAVIRAALPLRARKWLVCQMGRRAALNSSFVSVAVLKDFAKNDPPSFHRFMWQNHTGGWAYADSYEVPSRFGDRNLRPSRKELLAEMQRRLRRRGIDPACDVHSVFDAGCSLGYLLRFAETRLFPSATCLRGVDVDDYAIEAGSAYLGRVGSKIELVSGDLEDLDPIMGPRKYDVVLCCGVLMYLDEAMAARAVRTMLAHTRLLAGFISLANPLVDNAEMGASYAGERNYGYVHNVDAMIRKAGGKVVFREWAPEGRTTDDCHLFTIAEPE